MGDIVSQEYNGAPQSRTVTQTSVSHNWNNGRVTTTTQTQSLSFRSNPQPVTTTTLAPPSLPSAWPANTNMSGAVDNVQNLTADNGQQGAATGGSDNSNPKSKIPEEMPPSYEEVLANMQSGGSATMPMGMPHPGMPMPGYMTQGMPQTAPPAYTFGGTYKYIDFMPALIDGQMETFEHLIVKANSWLAGYPNVVIKHCDSVLIFSPHQLGYNHERVINIKSKMDTENTSYLRYLRVWFVDDLAAPTSQRVPQILYRNYTWDSPQATMDDLMKEVNATHYQLGGEIINIETLHLPSWLYNRPDITSWHENSFDNKQFIWYLRVFALATIDSIPGTIGYIDFIPETLQPYVSPVTQQVVAGPQPFNNQVCHVQNWWSNQAMNKGYYVLNLQSLYVKVKAQNKYWQRLHFTEFGTQDFMRRTTTYHQIIRVFYQKYQSMAHMAQIREPQHNLTCKTFMPRQLTSPIGQELQFEPLGELMKRVMTWIQHSNAKVVSMETISRRMYSNNHGIYSPEHTLVTTENAKLSKHEYWIQIIRVWIHGMFQEPHPGLFTPVVPVPPYYTAPHPRSVMVEGATHRLPSPAQNPPAS